MNQTANTITRMNPDGSKTNLVTGSDGKLIQQVKKKRYLKTKLKTKKVDEGKKAETKPTSAITKSANDKSKAHSNQKSSGKRDNKPQNKRRKIVVARKKPAQETSTTGVGSPKNNWKASSTWPLKDQFQNENYSKFKNQVREKRNLNEYANVPSEIEIPEAVAIKDLAHKLNLKGSQLIKKFFSLGVMDVTLNDSIDHDTAAIVCSELNCKVKVISLLEQAKVDVEVGDESDYISRYPVVTVMGHVDHGKTSLLDAIRETNVTSTESGGITQHIGAYKVKIDQGSVLFIDTPGHEAFSSMRARGARVTDIVILVVSAVDGVKPQTIEAISHAKAAKVPIIVAINKCDLEGANPENIKTQLSEHGLVTESWGGDTIFHNVSALKKQGLKELLETIVFQAEVMELKGNPKVKAYGYVIESRIEIGRGNVITVVIKNGTLRQGNIYVSGNATGKVRAMFDEQGKEVKEAGPSTPIEIIGISTLPQSGELFQIVENEKAGKRIVEMREQLNKERAAKKVKKVSLDSLDKALAAIKVNELKVLIKGDVFGSVEAIRETLVKQKNDEVKVTVIHFATGAITENDVNLASASDGLIIGFKVKPNGKARKLADQLGVEIKLYNIIYDIVDDIQGVLEGMLKSEKIEEEIGALEVKEIFKISGSGKIAGSVVTHGKVIFSAVIRLYRNEQFIHEGMIATLKRYKDDVKEVTEGSECGLQIKSYQDIKPGDVIKCYLVKEVKKKLRLSEDNS